MNQSVLTLSLANHFNFSEIKRKCDAKLRKKKIKKALNSPFQTNDILEGYHVDFAETMPEGQSGSAV